MAAANSAGLIPATWHGPLSQLSLFLVAMALSAIGLSTDIAALRRAGAKPLLLGAMLWVTVAAASLVLQLLTGTLHEETTRCRLLSVSKPRQSYTLAV
jgi:uncharacterized membrane protein YadS